VLLRGSDGVFSTGADMGYLFHAFGTNLQFEEGEFNFVKTRAEHGAKKAFELCKAHFDVPEP
jgi:hypothetical protein